MNSFETYVPGRAWEKILMATMGALVFLFGAVNLEEPLRLLVRGQPAQAEAWRVVRTAPGQPEQSYSSDLEVETAIQQGDRGAQFWNDFRFTSGDGREMTARLPVGSPIKPLFSLRDSDGLPSAMTVYYDPGEPAAVVFPGVIGTWFVPGMAVCLGLLELLLGLVLFFHSSRPITISQHPHPDLHQPLP